MSKNVIYENDGKNIYARIEGTDRRVKLDWTILTAEDIQKEISENEIWSKIRHAAKSDPTLHDALERVKIMYYLSIKNGT